MHPFSSLAFFNSDCTLMGGGILNGLEPSLGVINGSPHLTAGQVNVLTDHGRVPNGAASSSMVPRHRRSPQY